MPREASFALAFFGRLRKVQEPTFAVAAGQKSVALKRILEAVLVIFALFQTIRRLDSVDMLAIVSNRVHEIACITC